MLKNVKQLKEHDKGKTISVILNVLHELGYYVPEPQILNEYHLGVPQNREHIIIVGFNKDYLSDSFDDFHYLEGHVDSSVKAGNILETQVLDKFTISDKLYAGHIARRIKHKQNGNCFRFCMFNQNSAHTNTISARYYKNGSEALIEQEGKNPHMLTPCNVQDFKDFRKNL